MELVAVLEFPESAAARLAAMRARSMGEDLTSGCLRPAHLIVVSEPRPPCCEITSSARLAAGFLGAKYRR